MHHSIHSRRRTIRFNGRTVVISAALSTFGDTRRHSFDVARIEGFTNVGPGFSNPGRLTFKVKGAAGAVLENPAGGGDRVDLNTFCYNAVERGQVEKLVADLDKALAAK